MSEPAEDHRRKRLCVIDIGTQSVLSIIVEKRSRRNAGILHQDIISTRLGEDLWKGQIGRKPLERTVAALQAIKRSALEQGADEFSAFGTRVFRAAGNAGEVISVIKENTGLAVRVLSEEEEARFGFRGATWGYGDEAGITLIDIGGGSTEIVLGRKGRIIRWQSLPLGAVTLTENLQRANRLPADLGTINPDLLTGEQLIGIGGTVTTLAALDLSLSTYSSEAVDNHIIELKTVASIITRLDSQTLQEKRAYVCIDPDRADILSGGATILKEIMSAGRYSCLTVRDNGVRMGAALDLLALSED